MRAAAVALAFALGVAGCGGGAKGEDDGATPAPAAAKAAKSVDAQIKGFEYVPTQLTVASGGKVSWVNQDSANHTVTFEDKALKSIGNLRKGQRQSIVFDQPGSYAYVCNYHPNMRGTVVVK